jgi:hypothetical protein
VTTIAAPSIERVLEGVRPRADAAGVFAGTEIRDRMLVCRAKASAAPASYRLLVDSGGLWVTLVMADRWLSESVEADLMHTGDKVEELVAEELVEQGMPGVSVTCEHFRSEDMLFTFRSPVALPPGGTDDRAAVHAAAAWLLAYEAAFRNLGDMSAGEP